MSSPIRGSEPSFHDEPFSKPKKGEKSIEQRKAHEPAIDALKGVRTPGAEGRKLPTRKAKKETGKTEMPVTPVAKAKEAEDSGLAGAEKLSPFQLELKRKQAQREATGKIREEKTSPKGKEEKAGKSKKAIDTADVDAKPKDIDARLRR